MDTEQLISFSEDEIEGGNEGGAESPQPLRGPSLDEAAVWGLDLRVSHEEFGFRCSVHERDFHGGKGVIENIAEHIRISEKTVMVLTPDFTQSRWCMFEVELGMILSLEESQLLVIPVLVKDCPIPDSIETLTYINASSGNEWWQRFIDAILSTEEVVSFSGTREVAIQPRYNFDQVTAKMKTAAKLSLYCCNTTPCCVATFVWLLQMLTAAVTFMFLPPEDVTMLASSIILPLLLVTIFVGQRIWRTHRLKQAVVAVNNGLIENNVLVGFKAAWSTGATFRLRLTFWFFDMLECRDQAMDLLCRSSEAYTTAYQRGHLKVKDEVRHVRHALCHCQFVEQEHVGRLKTIPPEVV